MEFSTGNILADENTLLEEEEEDEEKDECGVTSPCYTQAGGEVVVDEPAISWKEEPVEVDLWCAEGGPSEMGAIGEGSCRDEEAEEEGSVVVPAYARVQPHTMMIPFDHTRNTCFTVT